MSYGGHLRGASPCVIDPKDTFSKLVGPRRAVGKKGGDGPGKRNLQAKVRRRVCTRFHLLSRSLVYSLIHPQNDFMSPTPCQALFQPWGAERGTNLASAAVRSQITTRLLARKASAGEDQSVMGVGDRQGGGRRVSEG